MKSAKLVSVAAVAAFFGLTYYATAMGFLPPEDLSEPISITTPSDDSSTATGLQKCLPHKAMPDEVCYVSGGIGTDDASEFKSLAKGFLLEIVFVQKADIEDSDRIEEYLASVSLRINDAKGNVVLDTMTDGPYFLADLPPGKYQLTAEYEGVTKTALVHIVTKKHQRTVFLWSR